MSINIKKYTKDQMAKMVEEAQEKTAEDTILVLVDACAENCNVYGSYVSSIEDVDEAKQALAEQAARCVERAMLDNNMFRVDGGTVSWKLLLYGGNSVKKYTKDQMVKMVEDAQAEVQKLKRVNATMTEQISQMNGESINKANEIANLKADADALRNKLADTEAALGRANADAAQQTSFAEYHKREYDAIVERYKTAALEEWRAKNHPWRNLLAWAKRKLGCKA